MSTPTLDPQAPVPTNIPISRLVLWSIKREFWENRALYFVPIVVAVLFLAGFLLRFIHVPAGVAFHGEYEFHHMHGDMTAHSDEMQMQSPTLAAMTIMAATLLVAMFYCLDALYSERRDRSILFWKSLPVSDLTAVLSKASIPMLLLPLLMFVVIVITQALILLFASFAFAAHGQSVAVTWGNAHFFQTSSILFFHLLAIHGLWYAPIYSWLLMVSAFARRAPFLWAVLPPLAIQLLEKMILGTSYFSRIVAHRFFGGPPREAPFVGHPMAMDSLTLADIGRFFIDPSLWAGLVVAAAFLALAVWLRRSREAM